MRLTGSVPNHRIRGRICSSFNHRCHVLIVNLASSRGAKARAGVAVVSQPLDLVMVGVHACVSIVLDGVQELY